MKKIVFCILGILFLLTACSKNLSNDSLFQLPDTYTLADAKSDDCVVFENGTITYGQSIWDDFITSTKNNKHSTVRLGFYYTPSDDDCPVLYMKDLSFDGKNFTIEGIEDGKLISKEYKYLLKYEGQPNSPTAIFSNYTYYVLLDDHSITWDEIERRMLSSQSGDWIDHFIVYSHTW